MEEAIQSEENEIRLEVLDHKISDLSQLVTLEAFKQAWQAEFATRVNHNYHNRNENKQAESIVSSILDCKDVYNLMAVMGLAEIAKENKTIDGKYSLYSDLLRVGFAAGVILINECYKGDNVDTVRSPFKYTPIVIQLAAILKTSYNGYQAAITRHLSNELTNSFITVVDDFILKCQENHLNHSDTNDLKIAHHEGFAGIPRNLGTCLNLLSMASNLPRLVLEYFPITIPFLGEKKNMGSYLAIAGGVLSLTGKRFSVFAAESSEKIVKEKMQEAADNFSLSGVDIESNQANSILENLTSIYKSRLVDPNFMTKYLKLPINFAKDSFYGSSYKLYGQLNSYFASKKDHESAVEIVIPDNSSSAVIIKLDEAKNFDSITDFSNADPKPKNIINPIESLRVDRQNNIQR